MKTSGLTGPSRRLSAICALILATQLAACGGGDGNDTTPPPSGSGEPPVTPPPPPPPPPPPATVSLKLTGKVTDEPIANAQVTATVGSQTFSATADATGAYSLDIEIEEANAGDFVTLSARGVGAQSFVEFTSLAGSFQSLLSAAGSDEILSSTESFSTQITNVSTAQAVFLVQANGGQPITSEAALSSAAVGVNAQDVLDLAAAIKLAVDDAQNNPLPAGTTSILALASDATARQTFINEVYENNPSAFAAAQVAIARDPDLAQNDGVVQRYLDSEGFTTAMLSTDGLFSFNYSGRIAHFDLYADGTGFENSETYDQPHTWTRDGSTIEVTYSTPVSTISYDTVNCNGTVAQFEAHYVSNGVDLTFLNERTVTITTTSQISYPSCPSLDGPKTSTVARSVLSMDNFKVIDVEELKGNAQTIYVWDSGQSAVVADVAEIYADGTGRALITGQDFTWELSADGGPEAEGKIIAAQFDGWTAEYLSFRDIDELSSDLFWEVRVGNDGDGGVYMGAGASVFADPEYAVTFTEQDVVGRFYQFGKGDETSGDARLGGFRLRFDANGMGAQENDYIDGNGNVQLDASAAFRWAIATGPVGVEVVVSQTYNTAINSYNCAVASANCIVFDERRIIPIVADDNRVYWMEVRRSAPSIGTTVADDTAPTQLVRFYDYEPFAEAASLSAKPKLGASRTKQRELLRGASQR
ncbi:hypothetical protein [Povalibacter sp.]|uniref:hypothetical protein n=1 Tax=Povalibacter sp. TaxID=1962978 RepID=UPI002F3F4893